MCRGPSRSVSPTSHGGQLARLRRSGPGDCLSKSREGVLMDAGRAVRVRPGLREVRDTLKRPTGSVKCRRLNLNSSVCELASPRLAATRTEMQLLRRESDRFGALE